jgi:hypothetical protein
MSTVRCSAFTIHALRLSLYRLARSSMAFSSDLLSRTWTCCSSESIPTMVPHVVREVAVFALVAVAAFIIAAFAADGQQLFGWPALTWISVGLAAWVAESVVSIPVRRR